MDGIRWARGWAATQLGLLLAQALLLFAGATLGTAYSISAAADLARLDHRETEYAVRALQRRFEEVSNEEIDKTAMTPEQASRAERAAESDIEFTQQELQRWQVQELAETEAILDQDMLADSRYRAGTTAAMAAFLLAALAEVLRGRREVEDRARQAALDADNAARLDAVLSQLRAVQAAEGGSRVVSTSDGYVKRWLRGWWRP